MTDVERSEVHEPAHGGAESQSPGGGTSAGGLGDELDGESVGAGREDGAEGLDMDREGEVNGHTGSTEHPSLDPHPSLPVPAEFDLAALPPNTHAPDSPTTHLITSLRDQLALVSDQAHELNTKLVSAIHSRADAEDALASLQHAHSALRAQADVLSSDLSSVTGAQAALETDLAGLRAAHGSLETDHAALQGRAEGLEREKQRWEESMNTGLLVERSQITAEMQKLAQGLVEEERRRGSAEERRQQVESEVDDLAASLFDQANQMVATEKMARASAEVRLKSTEENLAAAEAAMRDMQLHLQSLSSVSSVSAPGRRASRKPSLGSESRFLCSHLPYTEYLGFLSHLRSLRPLKETSKATFPPPLVVNLLAQPFLTRTVAEEHDPTLRLDIAPDLGWMTRKGVSQAVMAGDLVVEPLPADVLIANASADPHELTCSLCGKPIFPALAAAGTHMPSSPGSFGPPPLHPTQRVSSSRFSLKPYFKSSTSSPGPPGSGASPSASPMSSPNPNPAGAAHLGSLGNVYVFRVAKTDGAAGETQIKLYPLCKTGWCLERLRATCELWHFVRTGIIHPVWHGDDGHVLPTERERAEGTPRTVRHGSADTGGSSGFGGGSSRTSTALTPTLSGQSAISSASTAVATLSPTPEAPQPKQRKSGWGLGFGLNAAPKTAAPGSGGGWRSGWGRSGSGTGTASSAASNAASTPPASPGPGSAGNEYGALAEKGDPLAAASSEPAGLSLDLGSLDKAPLVEGEQEKQPAGTVTPQDEREAKKLIEEMNRAIPKDGQEAEGGDRVEELVEEKEQVAGEREAEPAASISGTEEEAVADPVVSEKEAKTAEPPAAVTESEAKPESSTETGAKTEVIPAPLEEEDEDDDDQLERLLAAAAAEDGEPAPTRLPKPEISISQSTPDQADTARVLDVKEQDEAIPAPSTSDKDEDEEGTEGYATPTEEQREPSLSGHGLSDPAEIVEPAATEGESAADRPLVVNTSETEAPAVVDLSSPGRPPRAATRTPVSATASDRAVPPSPLAGPPGSPAPALSAQTTPTAPALPPRRTVDLTPRASSPPARAGAVGPAPPPRHPQSHGAAGAGSGSPRAPPLPARQSGDGGPRTPNLQRSSGSSGGGAGAQGGGGAALGQLREGEVKGEEDRRYLVSMEGEGGEGAAEGWEAKTWRAVVRLKEDMWRARVGVEWVEVPQGEEGEDEK